MCYVSGCETEIWENCLCSRHYQRQRDKGITIEDMSFDQDLKRPGVNVPHGTMSGYKYHRCRCTPCTSTNTDDRRDYLQQRTAERRSFLQEIKIERGCIDCGYNTHPDALDFDHVRGEKKFNLGSCNRSWGSILEEIEKCDVVCAICHRIRTAERRCEASNSMPVSQ